MEDWLRDPETWKYLSIPVVAAVVGWFTNWVAVKLTFLPLEPWGKPPWLGWQGIIPSKAEKMAATFVDSTMVRLGTLQELFEELEPRRIAAHINHVVLPRLDGYTDEMMIREHPELWRSLPELVKSGVYLRVRQQMPQLVDNLLEELSADVEQVIDLKDMITGQLRADKQLLNRLFLESGAAEFRFIVRSGLYFGLPFGLVQMLVWYLYPGGWVLPTFGLLVGFATNWVALNIIFRPLRPRRLGPWTIQGLFLRRQLEVAGVWCRIVTHEMLTLRNLVRAMLTGPRAHRAEELIRNHIRTIVDEVAGLGRPIAQLTVGPETLTALREAAADKAVAVSEEPFEDHYFNLTRSRVAERMLRERMEQLPPEEFQDLLRPCFQEDEWKLILVGAVLGLLAGVAQWVLVFGA